jgi:hypothetical protein
MPFAGNGRERIIDGPLAEAELAQPSGIVAHGGRLYFTDSESSAIRYAELEGGRPQVRTIVGKHLFTFGDEDGHGDDVRLQHPLGIEALDGIVYITDTYNNKIKRIYPDERRAESFLGTGEPGHVDGPASRAAFHEPGGLSICGGRMYVADTNNHAIRVIDLTSMEVSTLLLSGI